MAILVSPFKFLAVQFPGRFLLVWALPAAMSALLICSFYVLSIDIPVFGPDGFLKNSASIFTVSGGFFVAALTILITNDHKVLNSEFVGEARPILRSDDEPMTRKRFLSLLFGYLSFVSFLIVCISLTAGFYKDVFNRLEGSPTFSAASAVAAMFFAFISLQTLFMAMIGLHYLTDRLHRSDGRAKFKKQSPKLPLPKETDW